MLKFFGKYSHWILLALIIISLLGSFFTGHYDTASMSFGVIGALAVGYLVYRIEADQKTKKKMN